MLCITSNVGVFELVRVDSLKQCGIILFGVLLYPIACAANDGHKFCAANDGHNFKHGCRPRGPTEQMKHRANEATYRRPN